MSAHVKAQALRFVRISGYAFVVSFLANGAHASWWQLLSLAAGAAEAGLRQVLPVRALDEVTAVLADVEKAASTVPPPADPTPPPAKG